MNLRDNNIERIADKTFDVLIIGGGINGAAAATAFAARGAKVALVDKGDFAGFTSQNSSNLVWGGIKYMETYEFPLVRQLCMSRNHLLRSYPSSIREIRFFTNLDKGFRFSPFLLYCGALLYWAIGNFFTRSPRFLTPQQINDDESTVNTDHSIGGFEYSDAFLYDNDARFVFNFIRSAINYNCTAVNYMESLGSICNAQGEWQTQLRNTRNGETYEVRSAVIINACGPYVDQQNKISELTTEHRHVFSKGIHLIVPQITNNKRVLTFFADDGRLFFAIPMGNRTMVGTTDTRVSTPETEVTTEDRHFVLDNINKRLNLAKPLTEVDIISERCGVRPLVIKTGDKNNKNEGDYLSIAYTSIKSGAEGLIVANSRPYAFDKLAVGKGGLSGDPLKNDTIRMVSEVRNKIGSKPIIIACGGISDEIDVWNCIAAGANLCQAYTAFIYNGPSFAYNINKKLSALMIDKNVESLEKIQGQSIIKR